MSVFEWFYSLPLLNVDWGASEFGAIAREAMTFGWDGAGRVRRLEERIRTLTEADEAIAFETGRAAMKWILQTGAARFGGGLKKEVILPGLLCRAVPEAVLSAGLEPVLCDVTEDLVMDIDSAGQVFDPEKTLAIVVPHIYGRPVSIPPFQKLADSGSALVIDDAAASLGERFEGRPLGLKGDGGLFSFSQGKAATAGGGGVLVLPRTSPFARSMEGRPALLPADRRRARVRFRRFIWFDLLRRYASPLERAANILGSRFPSKRRRTDPLTGIEARRMAGLQAGVALAQLDRLKRMADGKRENLRILEEELAGVPGIRVLAVAEETVPTRFVLETPDLSVQRKPSGIIEENPLARHLRRQGIEARYAYLPLDGYDDGAQWRRTSLDTTHRLGDRLLLLPFLPPLGRGEMARIGRAVRSFFGN